jgi:hypothetical protein
MSNEEIMESPYETLMATNYVLSEGMKKIGGRESFKNYVKLTFSDILKKDPMKCKINL